MPQQKLRTDPDPRYMAGTEGTGEYEVLAISDLGRLGVRYFDGERVRVRVEPYGSVDDRLAAMLPRELGWKQPGDDGQNRFSKEFHADWAAQEDVEKIYQFLTEAGTARTTKRGVLLGVAALLAVTALIVAARHAMR